ncbi:MAG TPA: hypothetical protein VHZ55_23100 [Bryobacteraceae bacterium]|jgi:hypothetical protein|nr:hypothetical protein [Bryobacteraceae bacterium]
MRSRLVFLVSAIVLVLVLSGWFVFRWRAKPAPTAQAVPTTSPKPITGPTPSGGSGVEPTNIYAHNLLLRKGPDFRVYVRWLRGQFMRSKANVDPSFDDTGSFFLNIKTGVIRANIGDICNYLNKDTSSGSPLKNIKITGDGEQVKISGTLHKIIPIPIMISGTLSAVPENDIQLQVSKIDILKVPLKGLLGKFHVQLADLFQGGGVPGIKVTGNTIRFDTQQLLPPPHIRGTLTAVKIENPDLEEVYGNARQDVEKVEQWRNFLRLSGGTIDFGKLTMHHVDLIMIDISKDAWFDLDLANYQTQLVNGYTHMTPQAGLQIFMPDLRDVPVNKANQNISIQWIKNRNVAPPPSVTASK